MVRYILILAILAVLSAAVYLAMTPPKAATVVAMDAPKPPATSAPTTIPHDPKLDQQKQLEGLKTAINRTPNELPLHLKLGKLLLQMNQPADAVKVLSDAYDRFVTGKAAASPKDIVHLKAALACALLDTNDIAKAQQLAQDALTSDSRDAYANDAMGNVLAAKREFDAADKHFDLASVLAPQDAEILCDWGIMLLTADRARDAEGHFRQAARMQQEESRYYLWLGRALRRQMRYGPAIRSEELAQQFSPRMPEPCVELGAIYEELKDFGKAETYLRAALSIDPSNVPATTELAHVLQTTDDPGQRNYIEAATLLGNGVELTRGKDMNLIIQQANALAQAQFYEQAQACMEKAIKLAKEQGLPGGEQEMLMQVSQKYAYLQSEADQKASGAPESHLMADPIFPSNGIPAGNIPQSPLSLPPASPATQGSR